MKLARPAGPPCCCRPRKKLSYGDIEESWSAYMQIFFRQLPNIVLFWDLWQHCCAQLLSQCSGTSLFHNKISPISAPWSPALEQGSDPPATRMRNGSVFVSARNSWNATTISQRCKSTGNFLNIVFVLPFQNKWWLTIEISLNFDV